MSEHVTYLAKCGCGFQDGRTDRQLLACPVHRNAGSLATPSTLMDNSPTYTASQVQEMKNAWVEKLAGLVEERLARLRKVQDERDALNKDTIVQDCKIDALETTLAQIRTTPIGDENNG